MRRAPASMAVIAGLLTAVFPMRGASAGGEARQAAVPVVTSAEAPRIACWFADGAGMHPTGGLEEFLNDRIGASGARVAIEPNTMHAVLRLLGLSGYSVFDPAAARKVAQATGADWVIWVKTVARDVESKKALSLPYLFNRRRMDAHVFFDVRVFSLAADAVAGSRRLRLSDHGETTWQHGEDERLDPAYNNDPVELHQRMRRLDWRAAAAISRYVAGLLNRNGGATVAAEIP